MTNFRTFILGLAAAFGLPWLCLIVLPVMKYQQLTPVAYDKDKDGVEGFFPPAPISAQGQLIYVREGCNQCHTQMIRPSQLGLDGWYKGWGQDQEARPVAARPARRSWQPPQAPPAALQGRSPRSPSAAPGSRPEAPGPPRDRPFRRRSPGQAGRWQACSPPPTGGSASRCSRRRPT